MKKVFLTYLLHPNKFSIGKSISLTKHILEKRGYEDIPCNLTFRRFAEHFKKQNYSKWILMREGEKAYHDKVEPYIERDISKLEVGDVLIADGHVLNFQVINPFTGKPINNNFKTEEELFVIISQQWRVQENNGTTFLPAKWATVKDNIFDKNNWTFFDEEVVFPNK